MKHLSSYVLLLLLAVLAACNSRQSQEMEAALEQAKAVYNKGENDTLLFIPELDKASAYYARKNDYGKAALAALYYGYAEKDYDRATAMTAFKDAEQYGEFVHDSLTVARAQYQMGRMLYFDYMKEEALSKLRNADLNYGKHDAERALALNMMACCHLFLCNYDSASYYLSQSLVYAERGNSSEAKQKILNNFAILYQKQGVFDKAIVYLRMVEAENDQEKLLNQLNLGNVFMALGEVDSAAHYYQFVENNLTNVEVRDETKVVAYESLSKFAESNSNLSLAIGYRKMYEKAIDAVWVKREKKHIFHIQKKYDYEALQNAVSQRIANKQRIIAMVSVLLTLVLIAFTISQVLLAKKRKQEMEAKERILYYVRQYYNLLEKQGKTMQQLAIVMDNKDDKALLDNLRATVFGKKEPWEALIEVFEIIHPNEMERINCQYPDLSELEKKHIILSYFNVSRQDESLLLKKNIHYIDKLRISVKKKTQKTAKKQ